MESQLDWHNARALLEWQVDLGATEAIQEQPVDRFALDPAPVKAPKIMPSVAKPPAAPQVPAIDSVAVARGLAEQSQTLEELAAAIGRFEFCDLRFAFCICVLLCVCDCMILYVCMCVCVCL